MDTYLKMAFWTAVSLLATAADVGAQVIDNAREYRACMLLVSRNPSQALESAQAWKGLGGGEPARHCEAVALLLLGHYPDAAARLEALATESRSEAPLRARMLGQAAQGWLLADQAERALGVLDAGLKLAPDDVEMQVDRASALAGLNRLAEAVEALNGVLARRPEHLDALAFRASAYRQLDRRDLALRDAETLLRLEPNHPEGLLERGNLRRLAGDTAGARADWTRILRLAPGSKTAEAAQTNLENMDVRPK